MVESINNIGAGYSGNNKQILETKFKEIQDKQGCLGNFWNGLKETFDVGQSASDCESMLQKYNNGEVTFEEAIAYIEDYEKKQESSSELLANIVTGAGSIAVATVAAAATGGASIGLTLAAAKGAPIGAALKAGVKTLDRATNEVEGDELDMSQIAKDVVSGAVTGVASSLSSGVGTGIKNANFGLTVLNGSKCAAACGTAAGAINYTAEALFDSDKDFDVKDFLVNSLTNGFVSATVGGIVGSGLYGISTLTGTVGKEVAKSTSKVIVQDSLTSAAAKSLGTIESNIIAA